MTGTQASISAKNRPSACQDPYEDHPHIMHECALTIGCAAPDRPVLRMPGALTPTSSRADRLGAFSFSTSVLERGRGSPVPAVAGAGRLDAGGGFAVSP